MSGVLGKKSFFLNLKTFIFFQGGLYKRRCAVVWSTTDLDGRTGRMSYNTLRTWIAASSSKRIRCPECMEEMTFGHFQKTHARAVHGCGPKTCSFCLGRYKWDKGATKSKIHTSHCLKCLKLLLEKYVIPSEPQPGPRLRANRLPVCLECKNFRPNPRDMRGRDRLSEYVGLYDVSEFHRPEWWSSASVNLFDESKGLHNDVTGIFSRFQDGTLRWFHLMVKHDAYDTFRREMLAIRSHIAILPYSCLCDGLTKKRVTHRHLILACYLEFDFLDVWRRKVRYDEPGSGKAKYCTEIKSPIHLANVIQYVSQHKSSCDGIREEVDESNARDYSHFMLDRHLPPHGIAWMSVLIPSGLEDLLKTKNKNKNVVCWVDKVATTYDRHHHRRWAVKVKDTDFEYLNCVLTLRRDLEFTEGFGDLHVTFLDGEIAYLRENPALLELTNDEWHAYQIETGNTFLRIKNKFNVLVKIQQNMMNQLLQREITLKRKWKDEEKERFHRLEKRLRTELEEEKRLRKENDETRKVLEGEIEGLRTELEEEKRLRIENQIAKCELERKIATQREIEEKVQQAKDALRREFEQEKDRWQRESEALRTKIAVWESMFLQRIERIVINNQSTQSSP